MSKEFYENPLCTRYSGDEMKRIFSNDRKFSTWRRLWTELARCEKELGIPITDAQVSELESAINDIDYDTADRYERSLRHDVMAHIRTYGERCPGAAGVIHLGATSSFVGDNTNLIEIRQAMLRIRSLLVEVIGDLAAFAKKYKDQPCLAYTHFQTAQPTTVGKRAAMWTADLISDLEALNFQLVTLKFFGCKGATGTGASFLELFGGDEGKVRQLEKMIAGKMGFEHVYPVSGQTYSRKIDFNVLSVLSGIAQSATKFATDVRLLAHMKELDEPFEKNQVGSSAMAYKRNPMRSERICSLGRYVMADLMNPAITASSQWLERTLDDSANKRISIPEAFLATDAILLLFINIVSGLNVYPKVIEKHLREELPFMATENILMHCVKAGGDRQELHEAIRQHSTETARRIKEEGGDNDLLERIANDSRFGLSLEELEKIMDVRSFIGCAPSQTEDFLKTAVAPVLEKYGAAEKEKIDIRV